jgi:hypothetical protein
MLAMTTITLFCARCGWAMERLFDDGENVRTGVFQCVNHNCRQYHSPHTFMFPTIPAIGTDPS